MYSSMHRIVEDVYARQPLEQQRPVLRGNCIGCSSTSAGRREGHRLGADTTSQSFATILPAKLSECSSSTSRQIHRKQSKYSWQWCLGTQHDKVERGQTDISDEFLCDAFTCCVGARYRNKHEMPIPDSPQFDSSATKHCIRMIEGSSPPAHIEAPVHFPDVDVLYVKDTPWLLEAALGSVNQLTSRQVRPTRTTLPRVRRAGNGKYRGWPSVPSSSPTSARCSREAKTNRTV